MNQLKWERLFTATGLLYDLTRKAILFAVLLVLLSQFIITVTRVSGSSMSPSLLSGEVLVIDRLIYRRTAPHRSDIVTLQFPGDPVREHYVKRIVGLPGEVVTVQDSDILIDGHLIAEPYLPNRLPSIKMNKSWTLGPDQYFVVGDNRVNSNDSRVFGPVEGRFLTGRVWLVIWPLDALQLY